VASLSSKIFKFLSLTPKPFFTYSAKYWASLLAKVALGAFA